MVKPATIIRGLNHKAHLTLRLDTTAKAQTSEVIVFAYANYIYVLILSIGVPYPHLQIYVQCLDKTGNNLLGQYTVIGIPSQVYQHSKGLSLPDYNLLISVPSREHIMLNDSLLIMDVTTVVSSWIDSTCVYQGDITKHLSIEQLDVTLMFRE